MWFVILVFVVKLCKTKKSWLVESKFNNSQAETGRWTLEKIDSPPILILDGFSECQPHQPDQDRVPVLTALSTPQPHFILPTRYYSSGC